MFVLTIGLLGIAALLPIGKFNVLEATKANQSSAAARSAMREVKVRRMLRPTNWLNYAGQQYPATNNAWQDPDQTATLRNPLDGGNSVCIDPKFIAFNGTDARFGKFPIELDNDPMTTPNPPRMTRVTLPALDTSPPTAMSLTVADRIFTWQADKIFAEPDDRTLRPGALLGPGTMDMRYQFDGRYSWLVTMTPAVAEGSMTDVLQRRFFDVSVVVFYQRDLEAPENLQTDRDVLPSERVVYADFINGSGLGGGVVRLWSDRVNNNTNDPEQSDFPEVRPGQWIMLSGWVDESSNFNTRYVDTSGTDGVFSERAVFKWYRVVAAEDLVHEVNFITSGSDDEWYQDVTLAGPDWTFQGPDPMGTMQTIISDADSGSSTTGFSAYATIIQGVVGVYTKTMMIDRWADR